MKRILFLLTLCIAFISCNTNAKSETSATGEEVSGKDCVEVLCFHGKQRCITCRTIEETTENLVNTEFADEIKSGKLVFRIIDITKEENEKIADKYEVTWSSLFIIRHKDGKEKVENMTEFAFANARKSPDTFKPGVSAKINEMLK